jgi:hypothetical protein
MEHWNDGIWVVTVIFHFKFLAKMIFNTKISPLLFPKPIIPVSHSDGTKSLPLKKY